MPAPSYTQMQSPIWVQLPPSLVQNSKRVLQTTKPKPSTTNGEARIKIIAALTKHHQYAEGGSLNQSPRKVKDLAEKADVARSTASVFFKANFASHSIYRNVFCRDTTRLVRKLKQLNEEFCQ
jgi:hypothetical protein